MFVIKQHLFGKLCVSSACRMALIYRCRAEEDFAADPRFIPGAVRRAHATVSELGFRIRGAFSGRYLREW